VQNVSVFLFIFFKTSKTKMIHRLCTHICCIRIMMIISLKEVIQRE